MTGGKVTSVSVVDVVAVDAVPGVSLIMIAAPVDADVAEGRRIFLRCVVPVAVKSSMMLRRLSGKK